MVDTVSCQMTVTTDISIDYILLLTRAKKRIILCIPAYGLRSLIGEGLVCLIGVFLVDLTCIHHSKACSLLTQPRDECFF